MYIIYWIDNKITVTCQKKEKNCIVDKMFDSPWIRNSMTFDGKRWKFLLNENDGISWNADLKKASTFHIICMDMS